jgi:hypothetical protein
LWFAGSRSSFERSYRWSFESLERSSLFAGLRSLVISARTWSSSGRVGLSRFFLLEALGRFAEKLACNVSFQ